MCPCCQSQDESLEHFLIICDSVKEAREPHLSNITTFMEINNIVHSHDNIIYAILDPMTLSNNAEFNCHTISADCMMIIQRIV